MPVFPCCLCCKQPPNYFTGFNFLHKKEEVNIASMLIQLSVTCCFAHQRLKSGGADILSLILVSTVLLGAREHLHYA